MPGNDVHVSMRNLLSGDRSVSHGYRHALTFGKGRFESGGNLLGHSSHGVDLGKGQVGEGSDMTEWNDKGVSRVHR